ncbi:uncharacterized protein LOC108118410 [Drosophila eugracilis]|uniref:uncharacterized protein LOC108118410 n=1 Tax=Drosophila eugracilis TaxID=29029 RepID=UPI001BDA4C04|nr:uncharacterized protein LOC108118410 [Drosophila eugracilis]
MINSKMIPKEQRSVETSKEVSQRLDRKFNFRDHSPGSFHSKTPVDRSSLNHNSSNTSIASRLSTSSGKSKGSAMKRKSSSTAYWGRYGIQLLKSEKRHKADIVKTEFMDKDKIEAHVIESSDSNSIDLPTISDSDSRKVLTSIKSISDIESNSMESDTEHREKTPERDEQSDRLRFLKIFGILPDISTLSVDGSMEIVKFSREDGKFLAAGEGSHRASESNALTDLQVENEYSEYRDIKSCSSDISIDSLTDSDEEIENVTLPDKASKEDINERLLRVEPRQTIIDDSDYDDVHMENLEAIENFLIAIMNQVVEYAERTSVRLKRVLDKEKLLNELGELTLDYQIELHRHQTLENLSTEYYIRRKEFAWVAEPKKFDMVNRERLMSALVELDNRLEQMNQTQKLCEKQIYELSKEKSAALDLDTERINHFKEKVRETLCKEGWNRIPLVLDDLFSKMKKIRDEMSYAREELFFVQHSLEAIKIKSEKFENLGNGLRVLEYISIDARNHALGLKLEDKDVELTRMRHGATCALHSMAHWANKKKMNQELLEKMKNKLKVQEQLKRDLKACFYKEMLYRDRLKKETDKLKKAGCLMHYPDLMRDYDATVEYVQTKQMEVKKLRLEHNRLERKISEVDANIKKISSSIRFKMSLVSSQLRFSSNRISRTGSQQFRYGF